MEDVLEAAESFRAAHQEIARPNNNGGIAGMKVTESRGGEVTVPITQEEAVQRSCMHRKTKYNSRCALGATSLSKLEVASAGIILALQSAIACRVYVKN